MSYRSAREIHYSPLSRLSLPSSMPLFQHLRYRAMETRCNYSLHQLFIVIRLSMCEIAHFTSDVVAAINSSVQMVTQKLYFFMASANGIGYSSEAARSEQETWTVNLNLIFQSFSPPFRRCQRIKPYKHFRFRQEARYSVVKMKNELVQFRLISFHVDRFGALFGPFDPRRESPCGQHCCHHHPFFIRPNDILTIG